MRTRRLVVALVASLSLAVPFLSVAPASAASGCVSKAEYKKIKKGMTKAKVAAVTGTKGRQLSSTSGFGITSEIRDYKTCSPFSYGSVTIMFSNGKVEIKSALWV